MTSNTKPITAPTINLYGALPGGKELRIATATDPERDTLITAAKLLGEIPLGNDLLGDMFKIDEEAAHTYGLVDNHTIFELLPVTRVEVAQPHRFFKNAILNWTMDLSPKDEHSIEEVYKISKTDSEPNWSALLFSSKYGDETELLIVSPTDYWQTQEVLCKAAIGKTVGELLEGHPDIFFADRDSVPVEHHDTVIDQYTLVANVAPNCNGIYFN